MHTPPLINVLSSVAEQASKSLVRDFGEITSLQGSGESIGIFVEKAKAKAEGSVHDLVHRTYPYANLHMKFAGLAEYSRSGEATWIINVMDGEANFRRGLPHFSLSFAVLESNRLIASLILDPLKHDLFWAYKGMGSFWKNGRMRVRQQHRPGPVVMVPSSGSDRFDRIGTLPFSNQVQLSWGSPSLDFAYLSVGRYDGLFFQEKCRSHDIYAGLFMVKESGGFASNRHGGFPSQKEDFIIAGNPYSYNLLGEKIPDSFFQDDAL